MKHTLLCATALALLCSAADAAVLVNRQNTPVSFIVEVNNVQQFITLAPGETYDTHSNTGTVSVGSQKPFAINGTTSLMISNGVVSTVPANVAVGGQVVNPQPVSQPILNPNAPPSTVNPPQSGGNLQNPLAPPETGNPNPPQYNANGGVTTGATTPVTPEPPVNSVPTPPTILPITGVPPTPQPLKK